MHAGGKRDADEAGNKQPKPGETVIDNTPWMSSLIYHDKGEDKQTLVPLMFLDTTFTTRTTTTTTTELFITLFSTMTITTTTTTMTTTTTKTVLPSYNCL